MLRRSAAILFISLLPINLALAGETGSCVCEGPKDEDGNINQTVIVYYDGGACTAVHWENGGQQGPASSSGEDCEELGCSKLIESAANDGDDATYCYDPDVPPPTPTPTPRPTPTATPPPPTATPTATPRSSPTATPSTTVTPSGGVKPVASVTPIKR